MRTKRAHFEIFRRECHRLHALWGLQSWALLVLWQALPVGYAGQARTNYDDRAFHVVFPRDWPELAPLNRKTILDAARHEMLHCLVEPFACLARARYVQQSELESEEESLVYRLQCAIWGPGASAGWGQ